MRRVLTVAAIVTMIAVMVVAACAQRGQRGQRAGRQMTEEERAQMRAQMIERMLEQTDLSDQEKAAAKSALTIKYQARQTLQAEMVKLRTVADDPDATDEQLQAALTAYRAALTEYQTTLAAEDTTLVGQLSLWSQVQCMYLGILENGLGMRAMGGRGGDMGGPGGGPPGGEQ